MLLCLDVGNTHILGGVFDNDKQIARFRYATHLIGTADQFGIFLLSILQANSIPPEKFPLQQYAPSSPVVILRFVTLSFYTLRLLSLFYNQALRQD